MSVSIATGLYGISFGALGVAAGLTPWQTQLLSLAMFTGGSQFAFVASLGGGGATALAAASLLGLRNAVYGAQMNALLHPTGVNRFVSAHFTIDESVAVAISSEDPVEQRKGFWWTGLGVFVAWNLLTLVGALATSTIDPTVWGLDGAAVAAFLGLLWPRLRSGDMIAIAGISAVVAVVATPWLPIGTPILLAAAVAALVGWWRR